ncbi:MAG: DUF3575 domain-containing protein [Bacteroidales bacterium]|nr:DUF3575 domain-containing protein [Bacteroidales bacterium]
MKHRFALAVCLFLTTILSAQEVSLSTNLLDWANLGTANLQAGISFSRHLSLHAGARYNKWDFGSAEKGTAFQNRARTASLGVRYWPWNVYSSWWLGLKAQAEEYNRGGLFKRLETEEGVAAGLGMGAGYSRMLDDHWNLDFALGLWAGRAWYTRYRCPRCGRTLQREDGTPIRDAVKWFILPSNDIQVSLTYIF